MNVQSKETRVTHTVDASLAMKERIRTDLRSAMLAGSSLEVGVLRALLTAIDNAQAVPVGDAHVRYKAQPFGTGSAEVPRARLNEDDVRMIIENEMRVRYSAAAELERCGKSEAAFEARTEASLIARYGTKA
jgi:uncharacterized protein YqeY